MESCCTVDLSTATDERTLTTQCSYSERRSPTGAATDLKIRDRCNVGSDGGNTRRRRWRLLGTRYDRRSLFWWLAFRRRKLCLKYHEFRGHKNGLIYPVFHYAWDLGTGCRNIRWLVSRAQAQATRRSRKAAPKRHRQLLRAAEIASPPLVDRSRSAISTEDVGMVRRPAGIAGAFADRMRQKMMRF